MAITFSTCLGRGRHRFRAFPARAAGRKLDGIPVVSQKKCLDCRVTRSVLADDTVRYWWSQKDGKFADG